MTEHTPKKVKVLTRLKITEVSAVDRGAGENCRIILSKRDDSDYSNTELSAEERARAKMEGRAALRDAEHIERRKREGGDEDRNRYFDLLTGRTTTAELYGLGKSYAADARGDEADRHDEETPVDELVGGGDGGGNSHHASQLANLLVESGKHPTRQAALDHLLHTASGQALLRRMHKHEDISPMSTTPEQHLSDLVKRVGIVAVAKQIVDDGKTYSLTEHEYTSLVTEHAKRAHPELSDAQAFEKTFMSPDTDGETIRKAYMAVKSAALQDDEAEAAAEADSRAAIKELQEIGKRRWPGLTTAQSFSRAFVTNSDLARRAYRRPTARSSFPFPK